METGPEGVGRSIHGCPYHTSNKHYDTRGLQKETGKLCALFGNDPPDSALAQKRKGKKVRKVTSFVGKKNFFFNCVFQRHRLRFQPQEHRFSLEGTMWQVVGLGVGVGCCYTCTF